MIGTLHQSPQSGPAPKGRVYSNQCTKGKAFCKVGVEKLCEFIKAFDKAN